MEPGKKDLQQILKELHDISENIKSLSTNRVSIPQVRDDDHSVHNDLEDLIGTIPFFLLNEDIFEKNQDIADFAVKLGINIPSPDKKKREDMVGRIVSSISKFDDNKIFELNKIIKSIKRSGPKKDKRNFFKDWEDAIKQMKL